MPDFSEARNRLRAIKRSSGYSQMQTLLFEALRQRNANTRLLPSFIIIGAQKAGTTSLFNYLQCHPEILTPSKKEIFFFDGGRKQGHDIYREKGLDWYRLHFPSTPNRKQSSQTYEATTSYLYSPVAASRIEETLPDVRLIAILRDPTKRAISHYQHNLRRGRETLSFLDAIHGEESRIASESKTTAALSRSERWFSYKARGRYFEQLLRYKSFLKNEQLLVLSSEQLFANPKETAQRIFNFLGLKEARIRRTARIHNSSSSKLHVMPDQINHLRQYFQSHNEALFDLIGERFPW